MKKMKKVVSVIAAAAMAASLLAGCGGSGGSSTTAAETKAAETTAAAAAETTAAEAAADTTAAPAAAENPVAGKKVAYIMLLPSATIFQMWKDSCASLCDALDVKFDFFFCDGDFNKWQDTIRTCASAGYDGLLVSHGNQDGSYVFLKEITEQYPDMKIVTFDTQFYTDGEYQKLPGVTQMFQQDKSLVTVLLDQMIEKYGEGVRLIKVWRGPNYNSPFDRREVGWQEYEAAGKIVTVGEVQPLQDSVDSANTVTAAYLQGVNRADVDGVLLTMTYMARAFTTQLLRMTTSTARTAMHFQWRRLILTRLTLPTCRPVLTSGPRPAHHRLDHERRDWYAYPYAGAGRPVR